MPPLTGGAAILAQMKARKAAAAESARCAEKRRVVFAYASQTGTASEIARTMHADATQRGLRADVMSLNELGFDSLGAQKTPVLVVVASSTGDGDPPDNAAATVLQLKKKGDEAMLKGVAFTLLGLGDSNYTRFMHVPRIIKERLTALGAAPFYTCVEADEVDGLEDTVDAWIEGLWEPLGKAVAGEAVPTVAVASTPAPAPKPAAAQASIAPSSTPAHAHEVANKDEASLGLVDGLAPEGVDLAGAPAPLPRRIQLEWHSADSDDARTAAATATAACDGSDAARAYRDPTGAYSAEQPFWAPVSEARYETAEWSDRTVLHLQFELGDSGMAYEAGDAVGVCPENDADLVDRVLKRVGRGAGDAFSVAAADGSGKALAAHLPCPCTLGHALSRCVDLTGVPRKTLLRMLAEHCADASEKRTLMFLTSRAGKDAYAHEILEQQPNLADLLDRFGSCSPPLDALLDALPPLMPRLYSVTTSPAAHPAQLQVALSVVSFQTRYGERRGVATTWLDRLTASVRSGGTASNVRLPIFLKRADVFKPPAELSKPVVMVGPGTGVAPFRGFLQRRAAMLKEQVPGGLSDSGELPDGVSPAWLYFGCRKPDEDFLYRADLESFEKQRTLNKLRVAFSRAQEDKVYVQHLMRQDAAELGALVCDGGYVFVCGDGARMVKDVHAALIEAVKLHKGCDDAQAASFLQGMVKDKRYVRDVWS